MDSPASLYARRHSEPLAAYLPSSNGGTHSRSRDLSVSPAIHSKHLLPDVGAARQNAEGTPRAPTPPTPASLLGAGRSSCDASDALSVRSVCPESPSARDRRSPPECDTPPMHVHSTSAEHTLDVHLPKELSPEMVTVSAKKGNRLSIVADVWYRENNCECVVPPSCSADSPNC